MENEITVEKKKEAQEFIIRGVKGEISLNYENDIDFTKLVNNLVKKIGKNIKIDYSLPNETTLSEKEKLIVDTIKDIFDKFNESDNEEEEKSSDDIPF